MTFMTNLDQLIKKTCIFSKFHKKSVKITVIVSQIERQKGINKMTECILTPQRSCVQWDYHFNSLHTQYYAFQPRRRKVQLWAHRHGGPPKILNFFCFVGLYNVYYKCIKPCIWHVCFCFQRNKTTKSSNEFKCSKDTYEFEKNIAHQNVKRILHTKGDCIKYLPFCRFLRVQGRIIY